MCERRRELTVSKKGILIRKKETNIELWRLCISRYKDKDHLIWSWKFTYFFDVHSALSREFVTCDAFLISSPRVDMVTHLCSKYRNFDDTLSKRYQKRSTYNIRVLGVFWLQDFHLVGYFSRGLSVNPIFCMRFDVPRYFIWRKIARGIK